MGTRGLYTFRYRGKYYIFYNHWDSYPENGLGDSIVNEIKILNFEEVKELLTLIKEEDAFTQEDNSQRSNFEGLYKALKNPKGYRLEYITNKEPTLSSGFDANYIYILDFDKEIFKVHYSSEKGDEYLKFKLGKIPEDWKDLIS